MRAGASEQQSDPRVVVLPPSSLGSPWALVGGVLYVADQGSPAANLALVERARRMLAFHRGA